MTRKHIHQNTTYNLGCQECFQALAIIFLVKVNYFGRAPKNKNKNIIQRKYINTRKEEQKSCM